MVEVEHQVTSKDVNPLEGKVDSTYLLILT